VRTHRSSTQRGRVACGLATLVPVLLAGCGALDVWSGTDQELQTIEQRRVAVARLERTPGSFRKTVRTEKEVDAALAKAPTSALVVKTVMRRNPDVRAALERWTEATSVIPQATAYQDPRVTFRYRGPTRSSSVEVTQAIPFPGKLTAQGQAALAKARAGRLDYEELQNALAALATGGLYGVYLRRRELKVLEENLTLLDRFVEIARALFGAGKASQQDVLKAEVERSTLKAQAAVAARRVDVALAGLNALLDRPPGSALGPVAEPKIPKARFDRPDLYVRALERRPELLAAIERAYGADAELRRARLEYLPDFVVGAGYDRNRRIPDDGATAMVGVRVPFWLGRIGAAVDEAEARSRRRRNEIESVRNRVLLEVKTAAALADAAAQEAAILDGETVPQARQAIEVAEAEYQAGRIEFLSLVDAERLLLQADLARYRALAELETRQADLTRAVGEKEHMEP